MTSADCQIDVRVSAQELVEALVVDGVLQVRNEFAGSEDQSQSVLPLLLQKRADKELLAYESQLSRHYFVDVDRAMDFLLD